MAAPTVDPMVEHWAAMKAVCWVVHSVAYSAALMVAQKAVN